MSANAVELVAADLRTAEQTRRPIPPPTASRGLSGLDEAYLVQQVNVRRRVAGGERIIGHKVGLTSEAMQRQLGVDQPDFGILTDAMLITDGGRLDLDTLIAPRLEAEFAFTIGEPPPAAAGIEDVRRSIAEVALAIEVIDSRVADWRIGLLDTVADNASSARFVVGPGVAASEELLVGLPQVFVELKRDGATVASGPGSAVLGDPVQALIWLVGTLARFGGALHPGDIVMAGAVHASLDVVPSRTWSVTAPGFEDVELQS